MRYAPMGHYAPPELRFWRLVRFMPSGCWEWQGSTALRGGYGQLRVGNRPVKAHRWVYEQTFGEIGNPKLVVMHVCDNPKCVRVAHLRVGTQGDNVRDMAAKGRHGRPNAKLTRCKRGHEFTPENTVREKDGHRACRECKNASRRVWYAQSVSR